MFDRKDEKVPKATIWLTIDFEKVKDRLNGITEKLEAVQLKFEPQSPNNSGMEKNKEDTL
jgi:hypothetical protein